MLINKESKVEINKNNKKVFKMFNNHNFGVKLAFKIKDIYFSIYKIF